MRLSGTSQKWPPYWLPRCAVDGAGVRTNVIQASERMRSPFHIPLCRVEQAEAREVARVRVDLAAQDEVAEPVGADERVAHADLVEQRLARELEVSWSLPIARFIA